MAPGAAGMRQSMNGSVGGYHRPIGYAKNSAANIIGSMPPALGRGGSQIVGNYPNGSPPALYNKGQVPVRSGSHMF